MEKQFGLGIDWWIDEFYDFDVDYCFGYVLGC